MPNRAFGFLIQVLQDEDGVLSMRISCTMLGGDLREGNEAERRVFLYMSRLDGKK